ncbi:hypothetical protein [Streptomyces sp. enrichment culture]
MGSKGFDPPQVRPVRSSMPLFAPVTTYRPGQGGLPASGDRFGHAAR